jgi:hypothetical protein
VKVEGRALRGAEGAARDGFVLEQAQIVELGAVAAAGELDERLFHAERPAVERACRGVFRDRRGERHGTGSSPMRTMSWPLSILADA